MSSIETNYINSLKSNVFDSLSAILTHGNIDLILKENLINAHIKNPKSASFQKYYFSTLNNEELYLSDDKFFRKFKMEYALQGIDNGFLDKLNDNKKVILKLIQENNLVELYFHTFRKAIVKYGNKTIEKDLGSFFAKLVHTFNPSEYCALDNPIKNYFGLEKESFFISFLVISSEYSNWASKNQSIIKFLKMNFEKADKNELIVHSKLTDLKLLDLIFWSKANPTS
jgi:hypothetical protein